MQGGGVEDSEAWDRNQPLTADEGLNMLNDLVDRLTADELNRRLGAIDCAETYIHVCRRAGGVTAPVRPKTCLVRGDRDNRRVDIQVFAGRAFVP